MEKVARENYCLRLYVTGTTPKSNRAIRNIKRICEEHLKAATAWKSSIFINNPFWPGASKLSRLQR